MRIVRPARAAPLSPAHLLLVAVMIAVATMPTLVDLVMQLILALKACVASGPPAVPPL